MFSINFSKKNNLVQLFCTSLESSQLNIKYFQVNMVAMISLMNFSLQNFSVMCTLKYVLISWAHSQERNSGRVLDAFKCSRTLEENEIGTNVKLCFPRIK